MPAPMIRKFKATISALNTEVRALDQETNEYQFILTKPNTILDITNSPNPSSGNYYVIRLFKNGVDTGRRFYSEALDPSSAGRMAVGPLDLSPGQYQFRVTQTAGTAADYGFIVKFARGVE
ncbi:MAG: hypothetical protein QW186_08710 [Candidatus Bathyarchaeia archaeon]